MKMLPLAVGIGCLMLLTNCASAGDSKSNVLLIQKLAPYDENLDVRESVREKCRLEERVPQAIRSAVQKRGVYDDAELADNVSVQSPGSVLTLKITNAAGYGGGPLSGPKFLSVEGKLWKDGKVIGTFTAARGASVGGAFRMLTRGTCGLLARCAKKIGKDVGEWLEAPTMNAGLGQAKEPISRSRRGKRQKDEDEKEDEE